MLTIDTATGLNLILGGALVGLILFARIFAFAFGTGWRRDRYYDSYRPVVGSRGLSTIIVAVLIIGILFRHHWPKIPDNTETDDTETLRSGLSVDNTLPLTVDLVTTDLLHSERDQASPSKYYYLQLGVFSKRQTAERYKTRLISAGHPAMILETKESPTPRWRIWLGPFSDRRTADDYRLEHGLHALLRQRTVCIAQKIKRDFSGFPK